MTSMEDGGHDGNNGENGGNMEENVKTAGDPTLDFP